MRTELYTVVDQGGIVVDVAVENSLYGELRGNLNLASRYDVDNFIQQAKDTPEALLSRMTGGVHLHTLHCPDAGSFERWSWKTCTPCWPKPRPAPTRWKRS